MSTSEQIDNQEFFAYNEKLHESADFSPEEVRRLQDYFSILEKRVLQNPESCLNQCGVYQVQNERDPAGALKITQYKYKNPILDRDVWLLAATDASNNLVGIKQTYFQQESPDILKAEGNIEVLRRGVGVASALENLHSQLLTNLVNEDTTTQQVHYIVDDANSRRIEELKLKLEVAQNTGDAVQLSEINESLLAARSQRKAWEKLYSAGGKLGFEGGATKLERHFTKGMDTSSSGIKYPEIQEEVDLQSLIHGVQSQLSSLSG